MCMIQLQGLHKSYGNVEVLRGVDLEVEQGDFMVIFGTPSSGKSVLVRVLAGLEQPDQGHMMLRGQDVTALAAGERNIGYVPQSFALFPNMTVAKNIAYPLTLNGMSQAEARPIVQKTAELLDIDTLLNRKPSDLSGGQKQRVAIARGLVKETEIFILDDPLVGLDFKLRERLIEDLKRTQRTLGVTFIYVTSDAIETLLLASKIAILHQGKISEVGKPDALYHNPQKAETMHYVGFPQANFINGRLQKTAASWRVQTDLFETAVRLATTADSLPEIKQAALVGLRPEHIHFGTPPSANALTCEASVYLREDLGGEEIIYLEAAQNRLVAVLRNDQKSQLSADIDENTAIWIDPTDLFVFESGQQIGRGQ